MDVAAGSKLMDATLGQVIDKLASLPASTVIRPAFGAPMSYRGYYDHVAFDPVEESTAGEMLKHAQHAMKGHFEGYKGGTYTYDRDTRCWIAQWGDCAADSIQVADVEAWGKPQQVVPISGTTLPVPKDSVTIKVQRLLSIDLDPEQFPGDEPDVVTITMGRAPVRYVRESEVR